MTGSPNRQTPANQVVGLPLPLAHFRLFMWFWHILYIGALLILLTLVVLENDGANPWGAAALGACVLLHVILYIWLIARHEDWPLPNWKALLYFGGSTVLWLVESELDMRFLWIGWVLVGQTFGVLRPRFAIPVSAMLAVLFFGRLRNWAILEIAPAEIVSWVGAVVLFLYIYSIAHTSIERSQLVANLQATQRQLEEARRNDVELAALRERERLARDLHDGLGHTLVALSVQLEAAQRLYPVDPARASAQLDAMKELVRGSMEELRRSLAGLRAIGLAGQSLPAALEGLCESYRQRTGITVTCGVCGEAERLPPLVNDTLWRVIQEALTNVEKHAGAQNVDIVLNIASQAAMLQVSDDGSGLTGNQGINGGNGGRNSGSRLGLLGMRERVEGVGGELHINERNPHGVCIAARIPLPGRSSEVETSG